MQDVIYIYPHIAINVCTGGSPNPMLEFMKEGPFSTGVRFDRNSSIGNFTLLGLFIICSCLMVTSAHLCLYRHPIWLRS